MTVVGVGMAFVGVCDVIGVFGVGSGSESESSHEIDCGVMGWRGHSYLPVDISNVIASLMSAVMSSCGRVTTIAGTAGF